MARDITLKSPGGVVVTVPTEAQAEFLRSKGFSEPEKGGGDAPPDPAAPGADKGKATKTKGKSK